jgi:NRAMP (natural resistance-associated macrophage protein)-like metal ion transporter
MNTPWAAVGRVRARVRRRLGREPAAAGAAAGVPLWRVYLAMLGPGLVAASAGNEAGGIATYASVGARYGYELLWVLVLILFGMIIVQEQCARMGAVTGDGLSDLIRERFGARWTVVAMLCLLTANAGVIVAEFVGIGAAAELFGVSRYLAVPVIAAAVWWLMVKGNYRRVERVFLALTLVFLAYPLSALIARPDWGLVLRGALIPTLRPDSEYLLLLVALVGTTLTPYMQMFQQDAVVEKGVTAADLPYARADVIVGCVFANLVSVFIVIATAAALYYPALAAGQPGVVIESAADAASALEPVAGRYATALFAAGIFGASMLAAGVLPLATAGSICEAFGWERGVGREASEAPVFYGLMTFLIVAGALLALVPGVPVIRLLIAVQVVNALLLPVMLVFITRMASDRELMGQYANGPRLRIAAWLVTGVIAALALVLVVVTGILPLFG